MSAVTLVVDGREVRARAGETVLWAALDAGIAIPNLCAIRGVRPPHGGCRLCYVAIDGLRPVTACTRAVADGMVVATRTPEVDRLVRSAFGLLLSVHRLNCRECPGNRRCALQEIARTRKVPLAGKRFPKIEPRPAIDESRAEIGYDASHCVLCGRCVHVCRNVVNRGVLDIAHRGLATAVSTFDGEPLAAQDCGDCVACADVCPVGAIYRRAGAGR
jgi:formate dehydrogenase major subunit/NADH-quinone oxidoreductase subunit G